MDQSLIAKVKKIDVFMTDVDGVLTDGRLYLGNNGEEFKAFDSKDGQGIKLAQKAGLTIAIITGRQSRLVDRRAKELDIREVYQGIDKKVDIYTELMDKYNLNDDQAAYIGDDVSDIPVLQKAGLALTVADAVSQVKEEVDYVASKPGGRGAVREVLDMILSFREQ